MKKLNQAGTLPALIILAVFVIALTGFAAWKIGSIKPKGQGSPATSTSTATHKAGPGEVQVAGTVRFAKQGPTDGVIGYEPESATLAIGSETSMTAWIKTPQDSEQGLSALSDVSKPNDIRIVDTEVGKLDVTIKRDTDVLCLVQTRTLSNQGDHTRKKEYSLLDCKTFVAPGGTAQADITMIGFGRSSIKCAAAACRIFDPMIE